MKEQSTSYLFQKGSSTLEILIASVVFTLTTTAVILVVFGNQQALLHTATRQQAIALAAEMSETLQAHAALDFNLINPATTTQTIGAALFEETTTVTQIDLFTKQATSTVSWREGAQQHRTSVTTLLTNPQAALRGDTCSSVLAGNWNAANLSPAVDIGPALGGNPPTSLVVFNKKIYITTSNTTGHNDDFYIFDIASSTQPRLQSSIDANTLTAGLNAAAVASSTGGTFIFVANGYGANFTTCAGGPNCAQLQIVNVSNPLAPAVIGNVKVPATSTPYTQGSAGQAVGDALYYKAGYLYLGLTKARSGPEFIIFDVGAGDGSLRNPKYVGSYTVGHGINSILVINNFAYVATDDNSRELLVLDISDKTHPAAVNFFDAPGSVGFGQGNALALVGNTLYFGRNYVRNGPEFYIFDASDPQSTLPMLGVLDLGTSTSTEGVSSILTRDNRTFITTTRFIQIWNSAKPTNLILEKEFSLQADGSIGITSGCEGNYLYVGAYRSATDKGVLYTLYPG